MKIKELYLASFGKFKDYRLTLEDGFNLLYGHNEDGKTTLMAFIRMMFYGSATRGSDLSKNPRKRYAPWDGSPMAGAITFSSDGTDYRLERVFLASNATDQITLTDLSTGEAERRTADIGQRFFGLSAAAFDRCAFIGQCLIGDKDEQAEGELNARLSSLAQTGDEGVSVQKLLSNLTDGKEELMSKGGNKGRYDKGAKQLEALKEELLFSRKAVENKQALAIQIDNKKNRLLSAQKDCDRYEAQLRAAEDYRNLKKLGDFVEASAMLSSLERKLKKTDGTLISAADLSRADQLTMDGKLAATRLEDATQQLSLCKETLTTTQASLTDHSCDGEKAAIKALRDEVERLSDEENRLTQQAEALSRQIDEANAQKSKIRPMFVILTLCGLLATAAGFVTDALRPLPWLVGGSLTLIGLLLTVLCKRKPKGAGKELTDQLASIQNRLGELKPDLAAKTTDLTAKTAALSVREETDGQNKARLDELIRREAALTKTVEELTATVTGSLQGLSELFPNVTPQTSFSGIEIILHAYHESLQKWETVTARLNLLKHDLGEDITVETAKAMQRQISREENAIGDPKTIRELLAFKRRELAETEKDLALDEARLATDFKNLRHPTELEHEIERLLAVLARQKAFCEASELACSLLSDAAAKLRQNYGERLEKRAGEIFSALTGGVYHALHISRSFDLQVEKTGVFGRKEWQYLSTGAADQAYFALRLAVSELLCEGKETLPLLLDDAFCQYDDTRQAVALAFLEDYAKQNQILFFTCHKLPTERIAVPICPPINEPSFE